MFISGKGLARDETGKTPIVAGDAFYVAQERPTNYQ